MANQVSYVEFQPAGYPGMMANMEEWNGITKIASANIAFGAPVQATGDNQCSPLVSGGRYIGVALARHLVTANGDTFVQYDNVPVEDMGVVYGLADAAIAARVLLNWNTATLRWTTATTSGTVIAVPGAESDDAAAAAGSLFKVRLRRIPS